MKLTHAAFELFLELAAHVFKFDPQIFHYVVHFRLFRDYIRQNLYMATCYFLDPHLSLV